MNFFDIIIGVLSILIGYVLGGILPAFIFGKVKGIDIREEGTKNAGTSNAFKVLGLSYAIPTALYDTLKGLLAMLIAYSLGADFIFIQVSGLAAIVGHVFPFYLDFKGGQGNATATGILLYYLVNYLTVSFNIFYVIIFLLILVTIFTYISKSGSLLPAVLFPLLGYSVFLIYPTSGYNLFFVIILIHIGSIGMYKVITEKKLVITDEEFLANWWRVAIRPVSLLFLIFYFIDVQLGLAVIGIVSLCFIALDIFRFVHKKTNVLLTEKTKAIYRKNEKNKFSSMTIFLMSTFIILLFFEIEIAIAALIFLVFGDMFGKVFGLAYGRHKIFEKTLEGTLAFIGSVILFGFILYTTIDIPLIVLLSGGIAAPLIELLPIGVNDNFSVPIISGAVMEATKLFIL
ncbi:MAG: glycerol-3-phosphate acyltransferase [Candidatus Lokiarchaeota archaeon]|nr:glycerol-3-phosphate acyltransferase [Candidatus Lokiarchaeota archaeon]